MEQRYYRADIDGLRAIAVALVICFHYGWGVPGGYVGVDVFFVISGYLITGLLRRESAVGRVDLVRFWFRRICRLMPAVWVLSVAVLGCSHLVLLAPDYRALAGSVASGQAMLANVFFWSQGGYFGVQSEFMPLLHTWSLSVEEQFYLFYPLLFWVSWRASARRVLALLAAIGVVSLVWSVEWSVHHANAAFYMLPTRAFEMLLGAGVAFLPRSKLHRSLAGIVGLLSLLILALSAFWFGPNTAWPGAAALVPCCAAMGIIWSGAVAGSRVAALLSWRPLVVIGLMSYSLYLWHWPPVALSYVVFGEDFFERWSVAVFVVSSVLSFLSWRFVETPLRRRLLSARRGAVFLGAAVAQSTLMIVAVFIWNSDGVPGRRPAEADRIAGFESAMPFEQEVSLSDVESGQAPVLALGSGTLRGELGERWLLWGDSHAMALAPAVVSVAERLGVEVVGATRSSTPPVLNCIPPSGERGNAPKWNNAVSELVTSGGFSTVFISGYWSMYQGIPGFVDGLRATVEALEEAGVRVCLVLDVATQDVHPPRYLSRQLNLGRSTGARGVHDSEHRERNRLTELLIRSLAEKSPEVSVFDPGSVLIGPEGHWSMICGEGVVYRDDDHLSEFGALLLVDALYAFVLAL